MREGEHTDSAEHDALSYEELYSTYYDRLVTKARHGYKVSDPEGTAQEVLLKAYLHLDSYHNEGKTHYPWLLTILRNTAISELRQTKSRVALTFVDDEYLFDSQQDFRSDDRFNEIELSETIKTAQECLSEHPQWFAALTMYALQGASYREISETLDIPIGTVSSSIRRSKEKLLSNAAFQAAAGR